MENENKKISKSSMILVIFGIVLILVGIVLPKLMFKSPDGEYSIDYVSTVSGGAYNLEIESDRKLNVDDEISLKVSSFGETKTYQLEFIIASEDEYTYRIINYKKDTLDKYSEIKIESASGKNLTFVYEDDMYSDFEDFKNNAGKIILTVFPCFFGVFFILIGLVSNFAKTKFKTIVKAKQDFVAGVISVDETRFEPKVSCKYCGLDNNINNAKCEYCGAPLIKKQKD